jgi:hypothetical protein
MTIETKPVNYSSGSTRKLTLNNKTAWDTRALRTVFLKIINENIKFEGALKHLVRCTVVYGRGRGSNFSGYAYLHSGTMRLRVPRPSDACWHCTKGEVDAGWPRDDGKEGLMFISGRPNPRPCEHCDGTGKSDKGMTLDAEDVFKLAHLFEHELAHCRGYQHKGMCSLNNWAHANATSYPYLDGITIGVRQVKPKPKATTADKQRVRLDRTLASIKAWESKLSRAETALKKLHARRKRYERALSA